jgi:hypothetical protein
MDVAVSSQFVIGSYFGLSSKLGLTEQGERLADIRFRHYYSEGYSIDFVAI